MHKSIPDTISSKQLPVDSQAGYLELFDALVGQDPDRVAIVSDEEEISYRQLQRMAATLASYLSSLGLPQGSVVGICLPRQPMLVASILATHAAGFAYVPIDPDFPVERSRFVLDDAGVALVLSNSGLAESLAPAHVNTLLLDEQWAQIERTADSVASLGFTLQRGYSPDRLAYIIYTSGSTGKPKGVRVTCGNLTNFLQSMQQCPGVSAQHRVLALTTIAFDIAQLELFLPLISGATICLAPGSVAVDGFALAEYIEAHEVTHAQATPSTWRLLQAADWSGHSDLTALCGGEALNTELAGWLLSRVKCLWNMYGPTETTVWSSCGLVNEECIRAGRIFIGQPIANTRFYLRQLTELSTETPEESLLCENDEPGELLIGGAGVADGYHHRENLTAKQFIKNPFDIDDLHCPVLYCTGDLVSLDANGNYVCHGRIDNQIKLRGFRIEPGEIETVLENHSLVSAAAVVLHSHEKNDYLVAYVETLIEDGQVLSQLLIELRELVGTKLPAYMSPRVYAHMQQLPKTPNAKLDRKALPAPGSQFFTPIEIIASHSDKIPENSSEPGKPSNNYVSPDESLSELEDEITVLWTNLTGQPHVERNSNFFEAGGHSLLAMKFLSTVREKYAVNIPLRCMATDTLAQIAARLDGRCTSAGLENMASTAIVRTDGYLVKGSRRIFYQIHAPVGQPSGRAVLIVPPLAHESMRAHRELFLLAESLASTGAEVMRFDLSATGHSAMSTDELAFEDWLEDVNDAAAHLCSTSNHSEVDIIAVRGAALLIKQSAGKVQPAFGVGHLILWDPVFDGAAHVRELSGLTDAVLRDLDRFRWRIASRSNYEIMGQIYSAGFLQEFASAYFSATGIYKAATSQHIVASQGYKFPRPEQVSMVGNTAVSTHGIIGKRSDWQIHRSDSSLDWHSISTVDSNIVAPDCLKKIRKLLS